MNGVDPVLRPSAMLTLGEVARAVGGRKAGIAAAPGGAPVSIAGVSTDTRTLAPGELFVAIRGERFDGHDHVAEGARRGAAAALVAREVATDPPIAQVVVEDPRRALGRLAAEWRSRFQLPVLALTGSNGKTTVKEMIAAILAAHCGTRDAVLATLGNLNNDIGLPLTLLRLREHHRYAVVEMGMNHAGEIDSLTRIAAPTAALVINAHRAHLGPLGSLEAVARAKGEIYAGLGAQGIALVNADDAFAPLWRGLNAGRRVIAFGMDEDADVRGRLEGAQLRLVTPTDAFAVTLQVAGEHNARNAIAACAAATALEIPPHDIQSGLAGFAGVPGRQQRRAGLGGATLIDDTYNANPESMQAALAVLAALPGRRVFVMGDMGELGPGSREMHAEVGAFARGLAIERLLAYGPESALAARAFGEGGEHFTDLDALVAAASREARPGTVILVKASRFMKMEHVADRLAAAGGRNAA